MEIKVSHNLSDADALIRIKKLIIETKKEFVNNISNPSEKWDLNIYKFKFSANQMTITGVIQLNNQSVIVSVNLPFLLLAFKHRIKQTVEDSLKSALHK